ncbi:MAG TPA: Ku protein [Gaiellaceae bacterium]|jgi:DNA end-binding protein Ku|nr:Ku protein [Gaiellaceae bacterium]
MPRAIWSGSIAFGLVNAPVKMYSAISEHKLELHMVHEKDGSPIGYDKICKKEGKSVPNDEIVKAYEVSDGEVVYLTDEDFQAAEEETYKTIEILDFVPRDEIDPIVFHRTYYLGPADGAEKVYALLLKAMESSELSAIARYVFHERQQLGALRIRDGVITLEHMYFADEIRPTTDVVPKKLPRVEKRELDMAETLIERFTSSFDHERYEDEYRKKLLKIVRQKQKGKEIHVEELEEREAPTDILEALKASVEAAKGTRNGKSRAKKAPARTKRKAKAKT